MGRIMTDTVPQLHPEQDGVFHVSRKIVWTYWIIWILLVVCGVALFLSFKPGFEFFGFVLTKESALILKGLAIFGIFYFIFYLILRFRYFISNMPAVIIDQKGCWIFDRMKDSPLPWQYIKGYRIREYDRGLFVPNGKEIILEASGYEPYARKLWGITLKPKISVTPLGLALEELEKALQKYTVKLQ